MAFFPLHGISRAEFFRVQCSSSFGFVVVFILLVLERVHGEQWLNPILSYFSVLARFLIGFARALLEYIQDNPRGSWCFESENSNQ